MDKPSCILGRLRQRGIDLDQDLIAQSSKSWLAKQGPHMKKQLLIARKPPSSSVQAQASYAASHGLVMGKRECHK